MADASTPVRVAVEILEHGKGLELPVFQTIGAAGADVRAAVDAPLTIAPGRVALLPTGLKVAVPRGYEIQVRPRSGLALKNQITVPNSPGTIDSDYRGEVCIILMNLGEREFVVQRGDRIAQLVLARVSQIAWDVVPSVDGTSRGTGGFGSTGV